MKRAALLLLAMLGGAGAQISAPGVEISIEPAAPIKYEVARQVLVQPARLEARLAPGYTTAMLTLTLLSEVNTEVTLHFSDPRLVQPASPAPVRLAAHTLHSLSLLAMGAHSGTLSVLNTQGQVIAQAPYTVLPAKTLSQGLSLNYSPGAGRGSLTYSVGGVPESLSDPRWNVNVNLSVSPGTGQVGGGIGVSLNW